MAKDGTTPIERFARAEHATLTGWLERQFGVKLTGEDVADVVSRAYADALADAGGLPYEELHPWIYRVARNRAISHIRAQEGQAATKRSSVSLPSCDAGEEDDGTDYHAPVAALVTDDDAAHAELIEDAVLRDSVARVHHALERLPETEREVLRLCAIDGVSIRSAVELTGLSKKQVETTRARALERFKLLIGAPVHDDCRRARRLITPGFLVDPAPAQWRDAHLSGCLGCQVQGDLAYGRRLQGVAPLLPVSYPAAGRLHALSAKLTGLLPGGGGLPPEALAAGVAPAGGAGAGGLIGAAASAKLAACGIAAVAVACVAAPAVRSIAAPATPHAKTTGRAVAPAGTPTAASAPGSATVTPTSPTLPAARAAGPASPASRRASAGRRAASRRRAAARRHARAAEFSPESFTPAPPATAPAPPAPAAAAATRPPAPAPRSGSSFDNEFSP